jgi:hypothetical protein
MEDQNQKSQPMPQRIGLVFPFLLFCSCWGQLLVFPIPSGSKNYDFLPFCWERPFFTWAKRGGDAADKKK